MIRHLLIAAAAFAASCAAIAATAQERQKVSIDPETGAYCVSTSLTGSRIPHTECHSVAEWKGLGVTFAERDKRDDQQNRLG